MLSFSVLCHCFGPQGSFLKQAPSDFSQFHWTRSGQSRPYLVRCSPEAEVIWLQVRAPQKKVLRHATVEHRVCNQNSGSEPNRISRRVAILIHSRTSAPWSESHSAGSKLFLGNRDRRTSLFIRRKIARDRKASSPYENSRTRQHWPALPVPAADVLFVQ